MGSYNIGTHDYEVRKKNASKFIIQGNRVKGTVVLKGREVQHDKIGVELLHRLSEDLGDICTMEGKPRREGRFLACTITPRQEVIKKIGEKKRAAEKEKRRAKEARRKEKAAQLQPTADVVAAAAATVVEESSKPVVNLNEDDDDGDDSLDSLLGGDDLT